MQVCTICQLPKSPNKYYTQKGRGRKRECKDCFKLRMSIRHETTKLTLVNEAGGKCTHCGYNKEPRILNFHHIDPTTKSFGIAQRLSAPINILRIEAAKCILLCPNCHQEKHLGVW